MEQRVKRVYDSVIDKFKSDRDFNTRLVDQEVSKALGISISSIVERNFTGRQEENALYCGNKFLEFQDLTPHT